MRTILIASKLSARPETKGSERTLAEGEDRNNHPSMEADELQGVAIRSR
jgi:hypothetical protein